MLEDRSYMREKPFRTGRSVTVILLITLGAVFVLQKAMETYTRFPFDYYFALSLEGMRHGFVWQLISYQFLHGNILHILVNCWVIYVFGRELEQILGVGRFLLLYLGSGFFGGIVQMLAAMVFPSMGLPVVGASAGAFGLVAAFATLYPERELTLLLFFILPIHVRAKFLLLFCVLISVFGVLVPTSNIAHAAHFGGLAAGVFYVRYAAQWEWKPPQFFRFHPRPKVKVMSAPGRSRPGALPTETSLPPEDFLAREVDPILDKISAHGIQSLTERERRVLQAARERMGK